MKLSGIIMRSVCASFLLGTAIPEVAAAGFGQWATPVDGRWDDPTRWLGGAIPNDVGALADFSNTTGESVNVTLDETVTLGFLFNSGEGFTGGLNLTGSGEVILASGDPNGAPGFNLRDATIGVRLSGTEGVNIAPTGAGVTLSGNNTYTGKTRIWGGIVTLGHNNALGAGGDANKTIVALEYGENAALALLNGVHIANETVLLGRAYTASNTSLGTLHVSGTNATATWGGTIEIGKGTPNVGSGTHSGNTLIITGDIVSNKVDGFASANSLEFTGAGTVVVQGEAKYTGTTTIRMGTVKLGGNERFSASTVLAVGMSGNTATFDLAGFDQTVSRVITGSSPSGPATRRTITNSNTSQRSTLFVTGDTNSAAMVYTGNLTIVKGGVSNMIVDALSTYTGDTWIKEGQLTLNGLTLADESDVYIESGGVLVWAAGVLGVDQIGSLFLDGNRLALGTYGSIGNLGADYQVDFIQGDGILEVTIPEPGTVAFVFGGAALLCLKRRRNQKGSPARFLFANRGL